MSSRPGVSHCLPVCVFFTSGCLARNKCRLGWAALPALLVACVAALLGAGPSLWGAK